MNLTISLSGLDVIARGLRTAPEFTRQVLTATMTEATGILWNEYSDRLFEHNASGITREAITTDVFSTPAGVLGVVGNTQASALFLELGTRPHFVGKEGIEALAAWAVDKLGVSKKEAKSVAFAVANKISKKGTAARRPLGLAAEFVEGQVVAMFERAAEQIADHIGGAAA